MKNQVSGQPNFESTFVSSFDLRKGSFPLHKILLLIEQKQKKTFVSSLLHLKYEIEIVKWKWISLPKDHKITAGPSKSIYDPCGQSLGTGLIFNILKNCNGFLDNYWNNFWKLENSNHTHSSNCRSVAYID